MHLSKVSSRAVGALFCATAALALAACGENEQETNYEADAADLSGGELQVADPDPDAVPVDIPETEMTNAPPQSGEPPAAQ